MAEGRDWRTIAIDLYRIASSQLRGLTAQQRAELHDEVEEMKEALLDLKQATIANDIARMLVHANEVIVLSIELRKKVEGDSDE